MCYDGRGGVSGWSGGSDCGGISPHDVEIWGAVGIWDAVDMACGNVRAFYDLCKYTMNATCDGEELS